MRPNIKQLCVTTWGAVLEVSSIRHYESDNFYIGTACVHDPNAIDAGMYISTNDIVLIAKVKSKKCKIST